LQPVAPLLHRELLGEKPCRRIRERRPKPVDLLKPATLIDADERAGCRRRRKPRRRLADERLTPFVGGFVNFNRRRRAELRRGCRLPLSLRLRGCSRCEEHKPSRRESKNESYAASSRDALQLAH